jgi:hypothetical protein
MKKILIFLMMLSFWVSESKAQDVFVHTSFTAIYDFIDELANEGVISLNSAVKPYSRQQIYRWLKQAEAADGLSKRMQKDIAFHLKDYKIHSDLPYSPYKDSKLNLSKRWTDHTAFQTDQLSMTYKDRLFTMKVKPIWGIDYRSNDNGYVQHFWGGLGVEASVGKHWGMYASLRDNSFTGDILARPNQFSQEMGGAYKYGEGGRAGDYSEMRGGLVYSWSWGHVGIIKDHLQYGDNYHGANILSGRTPSYAMIKLNMNPVKWFDFNYHHGWLVSMDIDSTNSYFVPGTNQYRAMYRQKFIAANMYTFIPFKGVSLTAGNSIIYSDLGGPHLAYMIPFMFFKSMDHTINRGIDNQNSQMFINMSLRRIKHLHLYGSMFVDEFKKERLGNDTLTNFISGKVGVRLSNWPIKNLILTYEYTKSTPMTYQHRVPATTFASNYYNLGHYLQDNSKETYFSIIYKPISRLRIKLDYMYAMHGEDSDYSYNLGNDVVKIPVLKDKTWDNTTISANIEYELLNDVFINAYLQRSNIQGYDFDGRTAQEYLDEFTPEFYHGKNTTFGLGFNIGF